MIGDAHVAVAVVVCVRMLALAHHGLIFLEEHDLAEIFAERPLLLGGESARGESGVHGLLRAEHLFEKGNELLPDARKERIVFFRRHPLFVLVEQDIVTLERIRLLPRRISAVKEDDLLQIRSDGRETARIFCLDELRIRLQENVLMPEVILFGDLCKFFGGLFRLLDLVTEDGIQLPARLIQRVDAIRIPFSGAVLVRHCGEFHELSVPVRLSGGRHRLLFPRVQKKWKRQRAETAVDLLVRFFGAFCFCVHSCSFSAFVFSIIARRAPIMQARGVVQSSFTRNACSFCSEKPFPM